MSITRRILFGASASWFSRGVTIVLGLVLMPILFRNMPKEELGIWLLLGQSWATLGILDFGFGVTLTRRIAFAKGRSDSDTAAEPVDVSDNEIPDLVATGLRIYRILAGVSFFVSFGLGFLYLRGLALESVPLSAVWVAWAVLCLSQAVMVWSTPWTALLQGVGHVGWDAILVSFVSALTLTGQIAAALCGGGLLSLAVVAAFGALLQRFVIFAFARRKRPDLFALRGIWRGDIFRRMAPSAWRAWLTALGLTAVANTDQLFIGSYEGAKALPAYRAAVLIFINLHFAAGVFAGASQVFISQLWVQGDLNQIRLIIRRNSLIGLLSMACGGAVVLSLGPILFDIWLGPGNFVGYTILFAIFACFFLEHQANIFGTAGRSTNDEAYAWMALIAAVLKIVLAFIMGKKWGILGIVLSTLFAQSLTSYWYMIYRGARRVGVPLRGHLMGVLIPCLVAFLIIYWVSKAIIFSDLIRGDSARFLLISALGSIVLAAAFWVLVPSASQRARMIRYIGFRGER